MINSNMPNLIFERIALPVVDSNRGGRLLVGTPPRLLRTHHNNMKATTHGRLFRMILTFFVASSIYILPRIYTVSLIYDAVVSMIVQPPT
jgi:hypothetical protein